jgi:hypothetical protein
VVESTGGKVNIFAALQGGDNGGEWALEKTIQVSGGMIG